MRPTVGIFANGERKFSLTSVEIARATKRRIVRGRLGVSCPFVKEMPRTMVQRGPCEASTAPSRESARQAQCFVRGLQWRCPCKVRCQHVFSSLPPPARSTPVMPRPRASHAAANSFRQWRWRLPCSPRLRRNIPAHVAQRFFISCCSNTPRRPKIRGAARDSRNSWAKALPVQLSLRQWSLWFQMIAFATNFQWRTFAEQNTDLTVPYRVCVRCR